MYHHMKSNISRDIYGRLAANFAFGPLRFYGGWIEIGELVRHGIDKFAVIVAEIEQFEGRIHVDWFIVVVLA